MVAGAPYLRLIWR